MLADPSRTYAAASAALHQAAEDADPVTRSNAIEALSQTVGADAGAVLKQALLDPSPMVRFAAAMAIGDVKYAPALPALREMAVDDKTNPRAEPDKRVYCAVIYAMHVMGDTSHTTSLAELLTDDQKEVRADAAMVMGKMREPSALVPLKMRLSRERDPTVEMEIMESLAMLGEEQSAIRLEANTKTQYMEDRLLAIRAMEQAPTGRAIIVLRGLTGERQPPRVRVAAAGTMAKLGQTDDKLYDLAVRALQDPRAMMQAFYGANRQVSQAEVSSLRDLAAVALGWMGRLHAVDILKPQFENSRDGGLRVAAAMSTLRLLAVYRPAGRAVAEPVAEAPVETPARPEAPVGRTSGLYTAGGKD
jgi:HEAT repeat protein